MVILDAKESPVWGIFFDINYSNLNGRFLQYIFIGFKKTKTAEMRAFLFYGLYFRKQSKNDRLNWNSLYQRKYPKRGFP